MSLSCVVVIPGLARADRTLEIERRQKVETALQRAGDKLAAFSDLEASRGKLDFVVHSIAFSPKEALQGRVVDVSYSAADALGMVGKGVAKVKLDVVQ